MEEEERVEKQSTSWNSILQIIGSSRSSKKVELFETTLLHSITRKSLSPEKLTELTQRLIWSAIQYPHSNRLELFKLLDVICDNYALHLMEILADQFHKVVSSFKNNADQKLCVVSSITSILWSWGIRLLRVFLHPNDSLIPIMIFEDLSTIADSLTDSNVMFKYGKKDVFNVLGTQAEQLVEAIRCVLEQASKASPASRMVLIEMLTFTLAKAHKSQIIPRSEIRAFFVSHILIPKQVVPSTTIHALSTSLREVFDSAALDELCSSLPKALLRAPEKTLPALVHLIRVNRVKISKKFAVSILPSLYSSLKSSQQSIRTEASRAIESLCDSLNHREVELEVFIEIASSLTSVKSLNPEQKTEHYKLIKFIPSFAAECEFVLDPLVQLLLKEQTELAATEGVVSLVCRLDKMHICGYDISESVGVNVQSAIKNAKPTIRKVWITEFANHLWKWRSAQSNPLDKLRHSLLAALRENVVKLANVATNYNTSYLEGYVYVALSNLNGDGLPSEDCGANKKILDADSKSSFLYSERLVEKHIQSDEATWAARCIGSTLCRSNGASPDKRLALGKSILTIILESKLWKSRIAALDSIHEAATLHPKLVNEITLAALEERLSEIATMTQNRPKQICNRLLQLSSKLVTASLNASDDIRAELLKALFFPVHLAQNENASIWVHQILANGFSPEEFVERNMDHLLAVLNSKFSSTIYIPAAARAEATVSLIAGDSLLKRIIIFAQDCMKRIATMNISDENIHIWKTKPGTLAIDSRLRGLLMMKFANDQVLANRKSKYAENKNLNKTEKWEQELRDSLMEKSHLAKKLSRDEQQLVDQELQRETEVRASMQRIFEEVTVSLNLVKGAILGNPDAARKKVLDFLDIIFHYVRINIDKLVGSEVVDTFLLFSGCAEDALLAKWLIYANLRLVGAGSLPEEWAQEPLGDLIMRLLYRIQFLSETKALDAVTFAIALRLIKAVLSQNGIGVNSLDDSLQQTTHAIGILSCHSSVGEQKGYPVNEMIEALLIAIERHPNLAKDARAALIELCGNISFPSEAFVNPLLKATLNQEPFVRSSAIHALAAFPNLRFKFLREVFIARHDDDDLSRQLANDIWQDNQMNVTETCVGDIVVLLEFPVLAVRSCASKALAEILQIFPEKYDDVLKNVIATYKTLAEDIIPELDSYGMVKPESLNRQDPWEAREGHAFALNEISADFNGSQLKLMFQFLIETSLGDRDERVRKAMLEAGLSAINNNGEGHVEMLAEIFEAYLVKAPIDDRAHDYIRQSVIILLGALASHLDNNDSRIPSIIDKLVDALKTPAEVVQYAVAECLPILVKNVKDQAKRLIARLLEDLLTAEKYGEQRGAAYGLAGVVKGRGIGALKEYEIMKRLKEAAENRNEAKERQGAMLAFETLSLFLGRLFEPYVIQILPLLLTGFGDASSDVRDATQDAARVIMGKISGHCVKLILPSLLNGLDDRQWRTKKGSIELLGAMAFCAPKQLSMSLPTIIPRLTDVLTDTHANVRSAANESLKKFGEVINNPEIHALVPILLQALSQPNAYTVQALGGLLSTSFAHYIDGPSLALVVPILERGLRERESETKRKAAQIVGSMASLTDSKDLSSYLSRLVPLVMEVLVDPVPDARATAAKALGTLVQTLGEEKFPDIVVSLIAVLKGDGSGVDRQGAAQGLSEILAGLGTERLEEMLPEIVNNANHSKPNIREGFLSLLIYLPTTYGNRFQPYLGRIIQPILNGLAHESDYVRDVSIRAGRMIIAKYANKAVDLLLPELEKGLFDPDWHIRQNSVQLVGDLLFRISGIQASVKEDSENDEVPVEVGSEASRKALFEVLGHERRDRILAALYMIRQDSSGLVRHSSIYVWKSLVSNTPKTVREILPSMITLIVTTLSSPNEELRQVAARTLGRELVRKLGVGILPQILPILQEGLKSDDDGTRQGVCFALPEVMDSLGSEAMSEFQDAFIPAIRTALLDKSENVREAAALAFDAFLNHVGNQAINEFVPSLLQALEGEDSENALSALKEMMAIRSNVIFPVLIPRLINVPISPFNARALAGLSTAAGRAINRRLSSIISAFVDTMTMTTDNDIMAELESSMKTILLTIDTEDGLVMLMSNLQALAKNEVFTRRVYGCKFNAIVYEGSHEDLSSYTADWIDLLISLLDDREDTVVCAALNSLNAVCRSIAKDDMDQYVIPLRKAIKNLGTSRVDVPGFSKPKAIGSPLAIFLQGLMFGNNDQREQSAVGIGEMVQKTSVDTLKPYVTQMTGPLIRVIGDRYPWTVKAAILVALEALLKKASVALKPFLPQLQRTFIKSLTDPSSSIIRSRAASALGILISMQTRVDPLIADLVTNIKSADPLVKDALLAALEKVIGNATTAIPAQSKSAISEMVVTCFAEGNSDAIVAGAARVLGKYSKRTAADEMEALVSQHLMIVPPTMSSMFGLNGVLADNPILFKQLDIVPRTVDIVVGAIKMDRSPITELSILAAGKMLLTKAFVNMAEFNGEQLLQALVDLLDEANPGSADARRLSLVCIRALARRNKAYIGQYMDIVVPRLLSSVRDRNIPVKLVAERALLYVFDMMESGNKRVDEYVSSADVATVKQLQDYQRRMLNRLVQQEKDRVSKLEYNGEDEIDKEAEEEDSEVWLVGSAEGTFDVDD